jgi:hypothetical protein
MAGNNVGEFRGEFSFDNVKIGSAHATGSHANKNFIRSGLRERNILASQRMALDWRGSFERDSSHRIPYSNHRTFPTT